MKKKCCLLLILILLFLSASQVFAAADTEIIGERVSAVSGEEFAYHVSIRGNPGIASYLILLQYDESVLTPVLVEDQAEELKCEYGSFCQSGVLVGSQRGGRLRIMWSSATSAGQDGTLFTIWFQVREDAELGEYPVSVTYSKAGTTAIDGSLVPMHCTDGSVVIREYAPTLFAGDFTAKPGAEFDCLISLQDNPGVASVNVAIQFDRNVLELVKDADGKAICTLQDGIPGGLTCKTYGNAVDLLWYHTGNMTRNGPFISVRLRVKTGAAVGPTTLQLVCRQTPLNEQEQPVSLAVKNGTLEIESSLETDVQIKNAHEASVQITGAAGDHAVIAFYTENGKMQLVRLQALHDGAATAEIYDASVDLRELYWKIMLLDTQNCPVCPAICMK